MSNVKKGFTLIELLLSISLITIIAGIFIPISQSFQMRNNLDIVANEIVQTLRRAQMLSQSVDGDISWGVKMQSGNIILFKGANYVSRDIAFDEIFEIPTNIILSGLSEIVYTKFTGLSQTIGTIILTINGEEKNIIINEKGMIEYYGAI